MGRVVRHERDIPSRLRGTPLADLLRWHNLGAPPGPCPSADLVVGLCMDHRVRLRIPENFAYILRTPAASLQGLEFGVAFGIGVGGARAIAVVGHEDCGMASVLRARAPLVQGLAARAGWSPPDAEELHRLGAPRFAIDDPGAFALREAERLGRLFPRVPVAAFLYHLPSGELEVLGEA